MSTCNILRYPNPQKLQRNQSLPGPTPPPKKSDTSDRCLVSEKRRATDIQWPGDILEKVSDSNETLRLIPGFHRGVNDIFVLLGCYTA
jgi:hypothetical protein